MKTISRNLLLPALACLTALCGSAQAVGVSNGDLLIGFYQKDSNGIIGANTYVFNLGPMALYRENSTNNISVSQVNPAITDANIAADLTTAFGSDWAESGTVYWGIVGGLNQTTTGLVSGDTQGTSYVSRPVSAFVASGSTTLQPQMAGSARNDLRNYNESFQVATNNIGTPGSNSRGAIIPTSFTDSFAKLINSVSGQFGVNQELTQRLEVGFVLGSADSEGALDLWRMINATSTAALNSSGADFTSGFGGGANVVLGRGQYCGTITLDASGELKIGGTADAPPGGNYASFATENGLTAAGEDTDGDGVKNLLEYALATNLTGPDAGLGAIVDRTISFNKREIAVANGDITYTIEESDDLGVTDAWQPVAASDTTTNISYTLPTGKGKVFARLKVTQAP